MTTSPNPLDLINLYQARAWVVFRTLTALEYARSEQALSTLTMYPRDMRPPEHEYQPAGTEVGIHDRLLAGALVGFVDVEGIAQPLPALAWRTRLKPGRHPPYNEVLVRRADVVSLWPARGLPVHNKPGRGRRPGVGSYRTSDQPLVERMHSMILAGKCGSPYPAAQSVVAETAGAGTEESKIKRLVDRYNELYPPT